MILGGTILIYLTGKRDTKFLTVINQSGSQNMEDMDDLVSIAVKNLENVTLETVNKRLSGAEESLETIHYSNKHAGSGGKRVNSDTVWIHTRTQDGSHYLFRSLSYRYTGNWTITEENFESLRFEKLFPSLSYSESDNNDNLIDMKKCQIIKIKSYQRTHNNISVILATMNQDNEYKFYVTSSDIKKEKKPWLLKGLSGGAVDKIYDFYKGNDGVVIFYKTKPDLSSSSSSSSSNQTQSSSKYIIAVYNVNGEQECDLKSEIDVVGGEYSKSFALLNAGKNINNGKLYWVEYHNGLGLFSSDIDGWKLSTRNIFGWMKNGDQNKPVFLYPSLNKKTLETSSNKIFDVPRQLFAGFSPSGKSTTSDVTDIATKTIMVQGYDIDNKNLPSKDVSVTRAFIYRGRSSSTSVGSVDAIIDGELDKLLQNLTIQTEYKNEMSTNGQVIDGFFVHDSDNWY